MVVLVIIVILCIAFAMIYNPKRKPEAMTPATLDSFDMTRCQEGQCVTVGYGDFRTPGNIMYFGNLVADPVYSEGGGGGKGGGGGGAAQTGYKYYLDIWEGIAGCGKYSIIKTWVQDKVATPSAALTEFNDGTESDYPDEIGPLANRLLGLSHIFYNRLELGEGVTYVPTIHFLMRRDMSSSPITYAVMTKGINPAAIIYDLHLQVGTSSTEINLVAFQAAADYWYTQGYGLNISFTEQKKLKEHVRQVLSYVDGAYGRDNNNKIYIKAFDPDEVSVATMNTEDFIEFTFTRKAWDATNNDFTGNYVDEDQEFSKRTIRVKNPANIRLQNRKRPVSIDLTGFRDKTSASKRLWEIMKKDSYPSAQIECTTNMKFMEVLVGYVVTVNNTEYGISNAKFRVLNKGIGEIDKNRLTFKLLQVSEALFDSTFAIAGESEWVTPDYTPTALTYQRVFELPYNKWTKPNKAFLCLGARAHDFETGFAVMFSTTGTDYIQQSVLGGWAQYGTLKAAYILGTLDIDDTIGILYTPWREDPEFLTLSRTDLFSRARYALIDNEIIKFQNVVPEGIADIRLTGIVRACFNTTKALHALNAPIWLFEVSDNIVTGINSEDFYIKFLPFFKNKVVDAVSATAIHVVSTNLAAIPWPPTIIKVVRTGTTCVATWWPTNQDKDGAGAKSAATQMDTEPMVFDQDFETYRTSETPTVIIAGTTRTYTLAGAHTFYVRARKDGYNSAYVSVAVGAGDGTYYGPLI